jgi:hypothetical protein
MFPTLGLVMQQILGIIGYQIEAKCIFSLVGILTNLRRCRLQIDNLEKLILIYNLMILDTSGPKNMADFIKFETNLVEELEKEFEGAFDEKFDA